MLRSATYRAPGVYVEWLDANPQHIELARTDVAGFIGVAQRGPLQIPTKIESARQFETTFGEAMEGACLAYAVQGFFANGGRTCWVVRVGDPAGSIPARLRLAPPGGKPFVLSAQSPGAWGNNIVVEPVWQTDGIIALTVIEGDRPSQLVPLDQGRPESLDPERERLMPTADRITLLGVPREVLPEFRPNTLVQVDEECPSSNILEQKRWRLNGGSGSSLVSV
jgi:hypothetical protein